MDNLRVTLETLLSGSHLTLELHVICFYHYTQNAHIRSQYLYIVVFLVVFLSLLCGHD
jgi:hypothetical protein